jgi:SAM-dependent methyltransferase
MSATFENSVRTHDQLYLAENRYKQPKEIFKFAAQLARQAGFGGDGMRMVDIGCAAGEFAYYLRESFPGAEISGYDLLPELVEKARANVAGIKFGVGSVLDRDLLPAGSFDVTFLVGVHSIFDDPGDCFRNLVHWTRPGGLVVVIGLFNNRDIDVWVRYRAAGAPQAPKELGWNLVSRKTAIEIVKVADPQASVEFFPFKMPIDLPPNDSDPVRSWTERRENGERFFTNGLSLIINLEAMVIRRP